MCFKKKNVFQPAGPNDMHHRALKALAGTTAEALANSRAQGVREAE